MRFSRIINAFVLLSLAFHPGYAQNSREISVAVDGTQRRAVVVNDLGPGHNTPVIIVLHGGQGSADAQRERSGFDGLAVSEGFTVVYPEGTEWAPGRHAWNTGFLMRRQVGQANDIAYLDALIDLLIRDHGADPRKIFMTGGSNGAMMTLVYATQRAERLAAIAPVVGAMFSFDTKPVRPLPILLINGGQDNEVPSEGGFSRNPLVSRNQAAPYKPLAETVQFWTAANRSLMPPEITRNGSVTTSVYRAAPNGAVTISVVDDVGGHGWPGTRARREGNVPIQSFDGAERVWEFFKTQSEIP
ncbi:alpha/beta hydrolase family esterase [Sphingorhabdus contaminans]|uniref:alpha/beta hydrolase family esterase n=1 Tax=Sphingorhabdus contaminans TaxID=1343899 RepID=UPI003D2B5059